MFNLYAWALINSLRELRAVASAKNAQNGMKLTALRSAEASKPMQRSRHLFWSSKKVNIKKRFSMLNKSQPHGNEQQSECTWKLRRRQKTDEKQSAIKINIGNFAVLSCCTFQFSSLLVFDSILNSAACTIFHRLRYLAQLRKEMKAKQSNFSLESWWLFRYVYDDH